MFHKTEYEAEYSSVEDAIGHSRVWWLGTVSLTLQAAIQYMHSLCLILIIGRIDCHKLCTYLAPFPRKADASDDKAVSRAYEKEQQIAMATGCIYKDREEPNFVDFYLFRKLCRV